MQQVDSVGGVARVSLPVGDGKGSPWVTLESSFTITVEENTPKARKKARETGWAETQEDLQKQIEETLSHVKGQLA